MAEAMTRTRDVEKSPALDSVSESVYWTTKDNAQVEIRPIHPEDEQRMIEFHKGLSERSVYMRYLESLSLGARTAHGRLARTAKQIV
jgi:hypothetical protein